MVWLGVAIVIATIYLLAKRYDSRVVLLGSGILMSCIALTPMQAFDAFAKSMTNGGLIQAICSVMGFAMVMKYTQCDKHLISFLGSGLKQVRPILIPGAVIGTFLINIALPSAAGTAAAVGAIFIPILMGAGVHPAMAAAAVKSGTYGSMLNPGLAHNPFVAKIAGIEVMDVIAFHYKANISSVIIAAVVITALAYFLKEQDGYKAENTETDEAFKTNFIYALVPILPIVILLLGTTKTFAILKMGVAPAMIIGAIIALAITRTDPVKLTKSFFDGMGGAYTEIMGIIICAGVFVAGMQSMGLVKSFIAYMVETPAIAKIAAAFGPFILGVISGSGDAATFAFNEAVTPHAAEFGLSAVQMGSMATLAGTLGRTMSPIAGATIICAGIAGANPMEVAKRTAPGVTLAMIVGMFMLMF